MTIASTTSKVSYNGSGSTGPFPITYKFTKNADITATKRASAGTETVLTLTTDYTLTGAGDASGGALTLTAALAVGESLVIARTPGIVQEVDYVENSAFPAETHEAALDLLTMICQSLQEQVDRAVKVEISSTTDPDDLLAELAADVVSAAASAATATASASTATTQAGLANTARIAAELAETHAETAETNAETAQGLAEAARDTVLGYASGATPWTAPDINGGTIDGATIGASNAGAGTFTLLQATSGAFLSGISLGGGSDILGNYEEGEWTPILRTVTGTYAHTYIGQTGRYIRNGNAVHLWCTIILTAKDSGMAESTVYVYGLPYSTGDVGAAARCAVEVQYVTLAANCTMAVGSVARNDNRLALGCRGSGIRGFSVIGSNIADNSNIGFNTTLYLGD